MNNIRVIPEERRNRIIDYLRSQRTATLSEISKEFNISNITARRDFEVLEKRGLIRKIYGGIELKNYFPIEPQILLRINTNVEEKRRIVEEASKRINNGDTLVIESGSTCLELLKTLKDKRKLNIITAAPHIINSLCDLKRKGEFDGEILCCGGFWRGDPDDIFVGPQAENFFNHIKITIAFVGILSVSIKDGWTAPSYYEAELIKKIISASEKIIGISDHTKFEKASFIKIGPLNLFDEIITNYGLDEKLLKQYQAKTKIVMV